MVTYKYRMHSVSQSWGMVPKMQTEGNHYCLVILCQCNESVIILSLEVLYMTCIWHSHRRAVHVRWLREWRATQRTVRVMKTPLHLPPLLEPLPPEDNGHRQLLLCAVAGRHFRSVCSSIGPYGLLSILLSFLICMFTYVSLCLSMPFSSVCISIGLHSLHSLLSLP